jgi:hypothetical protein
MLSGKNQVVGARAGFASSLPQISALSELSDDVIGDGSGGGQRRPGPPVRTNRSPQFEAGTEIPAGISSKQKQ